MFILFSIQVIIMATASLVKAWVKTDKADVVSATKLLIVKVIKVLTMSPTPQSFLPKTIFGLKEC
ncbi:hypothetical protein A2382_00315 [Candidatus Woesebacteria bacterium RIFOXYB1_FULL_38_16]|uniref:Uncharacterized protein n=1 Tax=Candidatus Woesebacteria bacterium RIFOXYB1_FULL_38_16 TaxID=1802538 RepID=A0A1F8CUH4_9BACT|nr:MAG: hypothetical protein A2191_01160 [Candidatus Woesebacteria bacterium RIFOXYA1_FULL_38_9]OGM79215.1 MAG: hypothetical protein A2382_00315 [Candidatus Woesebacteria bacterium RIFOXYB1_FULL_38_16]